MAPRATAGCGLLHVGDKRAGLCGRKHNDVLCLAITEPEVMMRRSLACAVFTMLGPLAAAAETPALFHMSVKDVPVENGKVLDMAFHEIAREPDASTVQILRRSGGSVSSSMFIVRGVCGVARARGEQFIQSERIKGDDERYQITFPKNAPASGTGFTMTQCALMGY